MRIPVPPRQAIRGSDRLGQRIYAVEGVARWTFHTPQQVAAGAPPLVFEPLADDAAKKLEAMP